MMLGNQTDQKILFVDDESINIEIFKLNFDHKYEIFYASSGKEALSVYKQNPDIGVILTDHKMPGMSGVELVAQLHEINPDTIRIIVTAFSEFQVILDAINRGHVYHYVLKPWDPKHLETVIDQAVMSWNLIRKNHQLAVEQIEINDRLQKANERMKLLSLKLINAQEAERKRISMDLHDDIGQNLIALKLQFHHFCSSIKPETNSETQTTVEIIRDTLQRTIDNTRNLSQNLSPAIIDEFGFDMALRDFLENFSRDYEIETDYKNLKIQDFLCQADQYQLYRIIQEIFNNIGKHSGTDRVYMAITPNTGNLIIEITDYGCGFDPEDNIEWPSCKRSLGLNTINERTHVLGGTVEIKSALNEGSKITLRVPCIDNSETPTTAH